MTLLKYIYNQILSFSFSTATYHHINLPSISFSTSYTCTILLSLSFSTTQHISSYVFSLSLFLYCTTYIILYYSILLLTLPPTHLYHTIYIYYLYLPASFCGYRLVRIKVCIQTQNWVGWEVNKKNYSWVHMFFHIIQIKISGQKKKKKILFITYLFYF